MISTEIDSLNFVRPSNRKINGKRNRQYPCQNIRECLELFPPVTLMQMKQVQLMTRTDRKYVIPVTLLPKLLSSVSSFYKVQEIDHKRIASYATVYYDTPDYLFYHTHVKGKLNRTKIRIRKYVDSELSFLEIKNKNNKGTTQKVRVPANKIEENNVSFLKQHIPNLNIQKLTPSLTNDFQRITLVNHNFTERLTIDFNIGVKNCREEKEARFPNLCIIEVKQSRRTPTPLINFLNNNHIHTSGLSKYCLGISITTDSVKRNNYKPKLHFLKKRLNHDLFC